MNSTKHLLHPELQVMAETKIIGEINDENLINCLPDLWNYEFRRTLAV